MMGFFTSPQICFGPGAVEQLSSLGARRALVVVDPTIARAGRQLRVVEELLKTETTVEVFSEVRIPPTLESLEPGVAAIRSFAPDWVVAVGGGSTVDTAKALWIAYEQPDVPLAEVTPLVDLRLRTKARFAAIPTTSGSGSETTWLAQIRDRDGAVIEVASRELVPNWALLDPSFPETLSPELSADGGAEVLAQSLEAFVSAWSNPFSDTLAREAASTIFSLLPKVFKHPDDGEARGPVHYAAALAGLAASNAQVGIAHALTNALTGAFPQSYGRVLGVLLPYAIEFNHPSAREKYATLLASLGGNGVDGRSSLADRVRLLWEQVGIPRSLEAAGLDAATFDRQLPTFVERAHRSTAIVANPRVPDSTELEGLFRSAFHGSPPR